MNQNNSTNVCVNIKEEQNAGMVDVYFPLIVSLSMFMTFGIFGNCFAFFIYNYKFEISTTQMFVVALSVCDLLTCAISIPFEIALLYHPFTFQNDIACRIMVFFITVVIICSGLIVFMIAIDRYRLICRSFEDQLTLANSKKIIVLLTFISVFLSFPMLFIHGKENRIVKQCGNIGEICSLAKSFEGTIFIFFYYTFGVTCWAVIFIVIMILYYSIAKRILEIDKIKKHKFKRFLKYSSAIFQFTDQEIEDIPADKLNIRRIRKSSLHPIQSNSIFFIITVLWVTSYVPHFISIYWNLSVKNFYDTASQKDQLMNAFLMVSYYPNCSINPYIYGLCNRQFRVEVKDLFRNICPLSKK